MTRPGLCWAHFLLLLGVVLTVPQRIINKSRQIRGQTIWKANAKFGEDNRPRQLALDKLPAAARRSASLRLPGRYSSLLPTPFVRYLSLVVYQVPSTWTGWRLPPAAALNQRRPQSKPRRGVKNLKCKHAARVPSSLPPLSLFSLSSLSLYTAVQSTFVVVAPRGHKSPKEIEKDSRSAHFGFNSLIRMNYLFRLSWALFPSPPPTPPLLRCRELFLSAGSLIYVATLHCALLYTVLHSNRSNYRKRGMQNLLTNIKIAREFISS